MAHSSVPPGNWLPRASHIQWLVHMGAQKPEPFALIQDSWRLSPSSRIPFVVISVAITLQFSFSFCQSCLSHSFPDTWALRDKPNLCPMCVSTQNNSHEEMNIVLLVKSINIFLCEILFWFCIYKAFSTMNQTMCIFSPSSFSSPYFYMSLFNSSGIHASVVWNLMKSSPPLPSILFTLSTHYGINHLLLHGFWVACGLISQVKSLNILNWELSNLECSRTSKIHM